MTYKDLIIASTLLTVLGWGWLFLREPGIALGFFLVAAGGFVWAEIEKRRA